MKSKVLDYISERMLKELGVSRSSSALKAKLSTLKANFDELIRHESGMSAEEFKKAKELFPHYETFLKSHQAKLLSVQQIHQSIPGKGSSNGATSTVRGKERARTNRTPRNEDPGKSGSDCYMMHKLLPVARYFRYLSPSAPLGEGSCSLSATGG
eukprot:sb/3473256/